MVRFLLLGGKTLHFIDKKVFFLGGLNVRTNCVLPASAPQDMGARIGNGVWIFNYPKADALSTGNLLARSK